jgi:PPOX class probable F420-dependent enzyme
MSTSIEISDYAQRRLNDEQVAWLTTVKPDGSPLPTPVWFIWADGTFVIFSTPSALKLKNIAHNARVAVNFNGDPHGGNIVVFSGVAMFDPNGITSTERAAYLTKYAQGIPNIGHTPESLEAAYSVVIRVTPDRVRADE